jgi:hypothetical protein
VDQMNLVLVIVLAYIVVLASAGIATMDHMNLSPTEDAYTSFVVVTLQDTKFGVSPAYLHVEMVIDSSVSAPSSSMLLYHSDRSNYFGVEPTYCCTPQLYTLGQCDTVGSLIIRNISSLKLSHALSNNYLVDSEMKVYLWPSFVGVGYTVTPNEQGSSTVEVNEHIEPEPTGVWYLVIAQCASNKTEHVTG